MNDELIEKMEKDLDELINKRKQFEPDSKEFTLLTNAIDKQADKIVKARAANYKYDVDDSSRQNEKELKEKELEMKEKQHEEEMKMKEAELDQKEDQHQEEIAQKEKSDKMRNIWTFVGIAATAAAGIATAVVTKRMDFANQEKWIPILMEFEKTDTFTYQASKAFERAVLKQ